MSSYQTAQIIHSRIRNLKYWVLNLIGSPVVVLLYHRVKSLPADVHSIAVSPENFRAHMEYLKQNFQIVRFEEDWSKLKAPAVAVTFDDGYADNALEALPILEEVGVPATFFVATGNIGTGNEFWWDELDRLALKESGYSLSFKLEDSQHGRAWSTATYQERSVMYWDLHRLAMKVSAERRMGWLRQVWEWAGQDRAVGEENRIMNQEELRILAQSRWATVGAHTVTHSPLSALSEEEQRSEIFSSKQQLERLLGREMTVFSYPFGKKADYDQKSIEICGEAGFLKVAAAFPGQAYSWTDPYQIPRHVVFNWDVKYFATRLKCLWI